MKNVIRRCLSICLLAMTCVPALAWQTLNRDIDIECLQSSDRLRINCDYRLLDAARVSSISAMLSDQALKLSSEQPWPWNNAKTAVLFLIDTSDPAREHVVRTNVKHMQQLLGSMDPSRHITGLATFDKNLVMLAPPGASHDEILAAAGKVQAVGKTTELYRNLLNAIDALSRVQADRKTIFLFSDGLAEDKAYFHSDVVASARKHNIVINSLGYPRSVSLSVALQVIRRISDETGGRYIEVDQQLQLPAEYINAPLQRVENGGRFSIDLKDIAYAGLAADTGITLDFASPGKKFKVTLPVQLPAAAKAPETPVPPAVTAKPPRATASEAVEPPPPAVIRETVTVTQPAVAEKGIARWFLYGIPIALVVLLLLTIASLIISFIKPRETKLPQVQLGDIKPYAYLVLQDETMRRYPITRTTWRIGRSKDNELTLDDNSISRRHAEIHRNQGDDFTIIDLDSLNGVFINSEKVKIQQLKEGDIVEIGDVNFRFTLHGADYSLEESTVMQKTKAPSYTH